MPDYSRKDDLQATVIRVLGRRRGSEALKAVVYWKETNTFWAIKQGGFLSAHEMARLRKELGTEQVYYAWVTDCDTDWTVAGGMHVQLTAVSAHLEQMVPPIGQRGLTAAANCHCNVSCTLEKESLPVNDTDSENDSDGDAAQADWWAFMRDVRSAAFNMHIPNAAARMDMPRGRARSAVAH